MIQASSKTLYVLKQPKGLKDLRDSRYVLMLGNVQLMATHSFTDVVISMLMACAVFDTELTPCLKTLRFLKRFAIGIDSILIGKKASRVAWKIMNPVR